MNGGEGTNLSAFSFEITDSARSPGCTLLQTPKIGRMEVFVRMLIVFSFLSAFFLVPMVSGQQGRPIPPGIREAQKQSNKPLDPAIAPTPSPPAPPNPKQ